MSLGIVINNYDSLNSIIYQRECLKHNVHRYCSSVNRVCFWLCRGPLICSYFLTIEKLTRNNGVKFSFINMQVSETLVLRNGDFLVRDSLTSVGDYVLTCRWDNEVLHFKISKVLVKSSETKVPFFSILSCFLSLLLISCS